MLALAVLISLTWDGRRCYVGPRNLRSLDSTCLNSFLVLWRSYHRKPYRWLATCSSVSASLHVRIALNNITDRYYTEINDLSNLTEICPFCEFSVRKTYRIFTKRTYILLKLTGPCLCVGYVFITDYCRYYNHYDHFFFLKNIFQNVLLILIVKIPRAKKSNQEKNNFITNIFST